MLAIKNKTWNIRVSCPMHVTSCMEDINGEVYLLLHPMLTSYSFQEQSTESKVYTVQPPAQWTTADGICFLLRLTLMLTDLKAYCIVFFAMRSSLLPYFVLYDTSIQERFTKHIFCMIMLCNYVLYLFGFLVVNCRSRMGKSSQRDHCYCCCFLAYCEPVRPAQPL